MEQGYTLCNFLAPTVIEASAHVDPPPPAFTVRVLRQMAPLYRQARGLVSPARQASATGAQSVPEIPSLNLEPGEWVEVRPLREIHKTLDAANKYRGLYFMPEMEAFCGGRFRVFKKVATIKLESTGEVRHLKSPTVFLEGAYCNGERHLGCDRACFHFWKEAWLKRIPGEKALPEPATPQKDI